MIQSLYPPGVLLPQEPGIDQLELNTRLTERCLQPLQAEIYLCLLEIRQLLDKPLQSQQPTKLGKPYPMGQCLEIAQTFERQWMKVTGSQLSPPAAAGLQALRDFVAAGGSIRLMWGDLRGMYFQNAFQLGTWYVDVANDTVVPSKPKVEILPFGQAQFRPVKDFGHFVRLASQYWGDALYPNHLLPDLSPLCPVLAVDAHGRIRLHDATQYMVALTLRDGFRPSEQFVQRDTLPVTVFESLCDQLAALGLEVPASPELGRAAAIAACSNARKERWHENPDWINQRMQRVLRVNQSLWGRGKVSVRVQAQKPAAINAPLQILFIHQNFPGQFQFLAPALAARGHTVVAMPLSDAAPHWWRGVRIVPYGVKRASSSQIHPWVRDFETKVIRGEACLQACLELKAQGFAPDVIVAHPGWGESLFVKDVWPQARLGIYCEFFYQPQGADVGFDPEFPAKDVMGACRLRVKNVNHVIHCELADAGISPTQWQASTFPELVRQKITVVHDGVDTERVSPNPDARLALDDGLSVIKQDEVITFVSRNLEPYRGYHIFMRALPGVLKRRPNARVLIVGGDHVSYGAPSESGQKWKDIFAAEVRPQISDADWGRVHFLGHLPYQHFIALLQISTVHVYLTYPFVLSWSLLEAMSAGCAIVASDTQPLREVIQHGETGWLVNFFDVNGLADRVCALLTDSATRTRLGANARAFVQSNYDLKTVCLPQQLSWVEGLNR